MKKALGINDLLAINFDDYPFDGQWEQAFGRPEKNFKMLITGPEKNGKTDFMLKLTKYLAQWGKAYINSHEEGRSKTLQEAFRRNDMQHVSGKVMLLHKEPFDTMMQRLAKKASPRFLVIDSLDYMELTDKQFKTLIDRFPRKSFIFLCWADTKDHPLLDSAKMIKKRVDITVLIKNRTCYPTSRFGGNTPFVFGPPIKSILQPGQQLSLIN
jgi:nucleoside-triphosphatase THEP1